MQQTRASRPRLEVCDNRDIGSPGLAVRSQGLQRLTAAPQVLRMSKTGVVLSIPGVGEKSDSQTRLPVSAEESPWGWGASRNWLSPLLTPRPVPWMGTGASNTGASAQPS